MKFIKLLGSNIIVIVTHLIISTVIFMVSMVEGYSSHSYFIKALWYLLGLCLMVGGYYSVGRWCLPKQDRKWLRLLSVIFLPILLVAVSPFDLYFYAMPAFGYIIPTLLVADKLGIHLPDMNPNQPMTFLILFMNTLYALIPVLFVWWGMRRRAKK